MTPQDDSRAVALTIDGRPLTAEPGAFVLDVARRAGIAIPTLCHHPDLEPAGACRLCVVEVGHADWSGWTGLVTACLYPVAPGLIVQTHSPRVLAARRRVLALLAAHCPRSAEIRALAETLFSRVTAALAVVGRTRRLRFREQDLAL